MPEEDPPSQQPVPPEPPSILGGVPVEEMFARGMQTPKMSHGTSGIWQPPALEAVAQLFPGYEVLRLLGRGGMGAVYQARQIELDRLVAIKLLPLEISADQEFVDRFRREARAMARLNHPNIIAVYDSGQTEEGHPFFVMEYVEGANLQDVIHQVGLDADQTLSVGNQVCTALAYAHRKGIVHRDIKPANVLINTESKVKVADFGLARLIGPGAGTEGYTTTGTVMGTPEYMAPEQMKGMDVDHRADIYSVGVMLYEMLCREVPKGIFDPPSHRTGCDARIDAIVIKAMHQAPDRRYQTTEEMRADIEAVGTAEIVNTPLPQRRARAGAARALVPLVRAASGRKSGASRWAVRVLALGVIAALGWFGWSRWVATTKAPGATLAPVAAETDPRAIRLWDTREKLPPGATWEQGAMRLKTQSATFITVPSRDARARASIRMNADAGGARLQLRYAEQDGHESGYRVVVNPRAGQLVLIAAHAGQYTTLQSWALPHASGPDDWLTLELQVLRDELTVTVDGVELGKVRDTSVAGPGGLRLYAPASGLFRAVSYVPLDAPAQSPAEALAALAAATRARPFENSLGMRFVPVPITGGPSGGQRVLFSIWETRVQDYEEAVRAGKLPPLSRPPYPQEPTHPVVNVTWDDAQAFCAWLTARERGDGRLPATLLYRLPTDHEWSCAVGLGEREDAETLPMTKNDKIADVFPWGRQWPPPRGAGNFPDATAQAAAPKPGGSFLEGYTDGHVFTAPVGRFTPSPSGLYDLSGNAWEWCDDWADAALPQRILRGGSYDFFSRAHLLSSHRTPNLPSARTSVYGFRAVIGDAATSPTNRPPEVTSPSGTFGGHRYQFIAETCSWAEAKLRAEKLGGHLAVITSQAEQDFIARLCEQPLAVYYKMAWLGAIRTAPDAAWSWVTGEPFQFTAWDSKSPSGKTVGDWLALMRATPTMGGRLAWNDYESGVAGDGIAFYLRGYIVEWETPGGR